METTQSSAPFYNLLVSSVAGFEGHLASRAGDATPQKRRKTKRRDIYPASLRDERNPWSRALALDGPDVTLEWKEPPLDLQWVGHGYDRVFVRTVAGCYL